MEEIKVNYTQRQLAEEVFHDERAHLCENEPFKIEAFCAKTCPENLFVLEQIGQLQDKIILDLGCGGGEAAIYFAWKGAEVDAIDISLNALSILKKRKFFYNLENKIHTIKAPTEHLPVVSEKYDIVFGNGILHHVNIESTIKEVFRVLKKGGTAVFIEPLTYNPIIKIYRMICRELRSEHETPLKYSDIKFMKTLFGNELHQEYHFFTLLIFIYFFIIGIDPNKVRYWKKIIYDEDKYKGIFNFLYKIDRSFFFLFSFLKKF
ncbi:MAG: class I SAM-dependent methyltransferase [Candidatus Staskawiczbacteria bacterium]|nr:class I SAM-dependent methyltransferase [Candidatus Staskawiczbacteria bacterium]